MQNFQYTFETRKRLFISVFSIRMTVPLVNSTIYSRVIAKVFDLLLSGGYEVS